MNGQKTQFGWESPADTEANELLFPRVCRMISGEGTALRILDIGCGNGSLARRLAESGHVVLGIDAAEDGIEIARSNTPRARFQACSLYSDGFVSVVGGNYDVVVSLEVIEHLYRPNVLIERAFAALKPGGLFILSTPYHGYLKNLALSLLNAWDRHFTVDWDGGHIKFFSHRTLERLLLATGFERIRFTGMGRMPYLWKSMLLEARK